MINRASPSDFRLQDMGTIYDVADGMADVAHRHDYYTVLLVASAAGQHVVDYETFHFGEAEVHFVSPGQVHQVNLTSRPTGRVITFTKAFSIENSIPLTFISNLSLFQRFGVTPPLKLDT